MGRGGHYEIIGIDTEGYSYPIRVVIHKKKYAEVKCGIMKGKGQRRKNTTTDGETQL